MWIVAKIKKGEIKTFRKGLIEKTDKNIIFLDGTIPLSDLKTQVDSGEYKVAFILKPIDINSLKKVADNNEIMPPKSTYVEPKLRSGLTIYKLY